MAAQPVVEDAVPVTLPVTNSGLLVHLPVAIFAFLTTGFLAYTLGVGSNFFPPVLGRYIGAVTVAMLAPSMLAYGATLSTSHNRWTSADAGFFLFTTIVAIFAVLNDSGYGYIHENATSHYFVVVQFLTLFFTMKLLPLEDKRDINILIALAIIGTISVLLFTRIDTGANGSNDPSDLADYQQVATYYVILLYVGSVLIKGLMPRVTLYLIGSIALFLNGARTEMVGWLFAIMVIEVFRSRKLAGFGLVIALLLFALVAGAGPVLAQYFPDNRIVLLLENTVYDQSYLERKYILDQAIITIENYPIFGNYGQYEPGRYAHNVLSVWQNFGLLPFLFFVGTLLFAFGHAISRYRAGRRDPVTLLLAATSAVALVEFAFAKAFSHPLYPITMAFYARSLMERSARGV